MFEGFSFSSPSSSDRPCRRTAVTEEEMFGNCDGSMISPLSSRCPSPVTFPRPSKDRSPFSRRPRSQFNLGPAPTSIPPSYSDRHRLSIGSLTRRLCAQTLDKDVSSNSDDGHAFPITPPGTAHGDISASWPRREPLTPPETDRDDDLSVGEPSAYSMGKFPRSSAARQSQRDRQRDPEQVLSIRQQRERLSLLQCTSSTASETVHFARLMEEDERFRFDDVEEDRHPSSLPPQLPSRRRMSAFSHNTLRQNSLSRAAGSEGGSRSKLPIGLGTKVDKTQYSNNGNNSSRDCRKRVKSGQGQQRKSLVLAAVTAMVEAETADRERQGREAEEREMKDGREEEVDCFSHRPCTRTAGALDLTPPRPILQKGEVSGRAKSHSDVL